MAERRPRAWLIATIAVLGAIAAPPALDGVGAIAGLPGRAPPAAAQEPQASLPDIEDEVMCPICGTALNLSESPQAERERAFIRRLIAEGRGKEEIKDALVAEYGPEVLATPEAEGFDLVAWVVPGAGILAAIVALALGVRRWRGRGRHAADAEPAATPEGSASEAKRLDADLARYDL